MCSTVSGGAIGDVTVGDLTVVDAAVGDVAVCDPNDGMDLIRII